MQKYYRWNPSTCICDDSKYLKLIADASVTEFDEIIIGMDTISTKKTNTIATKCYEYRYNNCHNKKIRD